jgi:hypothetical protein
MDLSEQEIEELKAKSKSVEELHKKQTQGTSMILFKAAFSYPHPELHGTETGMDIIFEADSESPKIAAEDALRFYRGRQKAMPEYFGALWCLKLYRFRPSKIALDGNIGPSISFPIFEWKHDWGHSIETHLEGVL